MWLVKRLHTNARVRNALCWLAAQYIRLVWATGDWRILRDDIPERFFATNRPFVVAFWHGRLLMMPCGWPRNRPMHMLISHHRDGELIARTIGYFNLGAIRGSSRRGGASALRAMVRALRAGDSVGVTPDGPRGPMMRAGDGPVMAARLGSVPILPVTNACSRRFLLRTWDRFAVALPFSRGVLLWGEPIEVPEQADPVALEAVRRQLEDSLNTLTDQADRMVGRQPLVPGDARA